MSLDIRASHVSGEAHLYLPAVGTAQPANPFITPNPTTFPELGHTSFDDGFTITPSISTDLKKTHQSPSGARNVVTDYSIEISVTAQQVDVFTLPLFFGAGGTQSDGSYWVPRSPVPFESGLYIRSLDGDAVLPIMVPRVSVIADGDLVLKPGDLTPLPLKFTVLDYASAPGLARLLGVGVTSIASVPTTASVSVASGNSVSPVITATFTDASTRVVTPYVQWTSSDTSKVAVSAFGAITAVAAGSATVTASYGGRTVTIAVTATA